MKKTLYILSALLSMALLVGAFGFAFLQTGHTKAASSCQATTFTQDGTPNLTAAMVVTTTNFSISTSVNGSGCDIGIYIGPGLKGTINNTNVFGATYDGIVNDGGNVTVTNSRIHDIGNSPLNGDQFGDGIYFSEFHHSIGTIKNNILWNYQKNGIMVRGVGSRATINLNTVIGEGPVAYIAQNGIEVGAGATGSVTYNIVDGNSYTGSGLATAAGILIYGGSCYGVSISTGVKVQHNVVIGNDIGVSLSNLDGTSCTPTFTPTNMNVTSNIITNDAINNTTGYSATAGYQAGIADQGDNDTMSSNSICGLGYATLNTPPPYLYPIDISATNSPTVSNNTSCQDGSSVSPNALVFRAHTIHHKKYLHISI